MPWICTGRSSFSAGSTPRLRSLWLVGIPFPTLGKQNYISLPMTLSISASVENSPDIFHRGDGHHPVRIDKVPKTRLHSDPLESGETSRPTSSYRDMRFSPCSHNAGSQGFRRVLGGPRVPNRRPSTRKRQCPTRHCFATSSSAQKRSRHPFGVEITLPRRWHVQRGNAKAGNLVQNEPVCFQAWRRSANPIHHVSPARLGTPRHLRISRWMRE